jgi:PAS domain S-box-containing protein
LVEFLLRLKDHRSRLSDLGRRTPAGDSPNSVDLAEETVELAEALQVAEEELRAQHEELAAVRLELDRVLTRNEELYGSSSDAFVITDTRGMIVEANRAAQELFGMTKPGVRRAIASMFRPPYRRSIRSLISEAATGGNRQTGEVWLGRAGEELLVDVTVELRTEPLTGAALLRWRFAPHRGEQRPLLRLVTTNRPGSATPATGSVDTDSELSRLLSVARADLASELSDEQGPEVLLQRIVELTLRWVPGTEHASVARVLDDHTLRTAAASGDTALACDKVQNQTEQGPAFNAIGEHATIRVDDLTQERRWPAFAQRAAETQIRSVLVCELPVTRGAPATLNMYSSQPDAFTAIAELVAPVFAARASIAIGHTDDVHNLRQAIVTRQTIGQAAGILMERHKFTADEAFDRLVTASQNRHIKLREIAAQVVQTGEEPDEITPSWATRTSGTPRDASRAATRVRPRRPSDATAANGTGPERTHEQVAVPTGPIADVTLRLFAEFGTRVPLTNVLDTVRECCSELDAIPVAAMPELVERLARQRLLEISDHPSSQL